MLAIRNGFLCTLPLVVVGSLAELVNNLPVVWYQHEMLALFGSDWKQYGIMLSRGTFGCLSLPMLFGISYYQTLQYNRSHPLAPINPMIVALVSFASLVVMLPVGQGDQWFQANWLGSSGLFAGIVIALCSSRLFLLMTDIDMLRVRLYAAGVGSAMTQAFICMLPGMMTIMIFALASLALRSLTGLSLHEWVHQLILYPFSLFQDSQGISIIYVFTCQLVWFFGIHGTNVLDPVTHQFYESVMNANLAAATAGLPAPHVITKLVLDIFVFIGGSGSSLCLVMAILLASRHKGNIHLAKLSFAPALFNINEILIFGLPVILNPVFLIPFVLVPLILLANSYIAITLGWIPEPLTKIDWTTPALIGGYMSTGGSLRGMLLQCVNIVIGTLLYWPFVRIADRIKEDQQKEAMTGLMDIACSNVVGPSGKKCLDHDDDVGELGRALAGDLQLALRENSGLFLEFQPLTDSRSGRVVGAEALVRWRHSVYGLIAPPIAVTVAEDADFVHALGLWVFHRSCEARKQWQLQGIEDNFKLAVNVSTRQLEDEYLADKFTAIMSRYDLKPSMIGVEVTESIALDPQSRHNHVLYEIHKRGLAISVDDFGMGHSSMLYLKYFPVSTLKIDQVLSKDVATNHISSEIIATIVDLCRSLDIEVVVEFVDNDEQIAALNRLGCYIHQGYYYSRPISSEHLVTYVQEHNDIAPRDLNQRPSPCLNDAQQVSHDG